MPDGLNEVKIFFAHPKSKNGKTRCTILFGTIECRHALKTVIADVAIRRDNRDAQNRVVARTWALTKALTVARDRSALSEEQSNHIYDNVPMRKRTEGQRKKEKNVNP